jgi:hypothetical protein
MAAREGTLVSLLSGRMNIARIQGGRTHVRSIYSQPLAQSPNFRIWTAFFRPYPKIRISPPPLWGGVGGGV